MLCAAAQKEEKHTYILEACDFHTHPSKVPHDCVCVLMPTALCSPAALRYIFVLRLLFLLLFAIYICSTVALIYTFINVTIVIVFLLLLFVCSCHCSAALFSRLSGFFFTTVTAPHLSMAHDLHAHLAEVLAFQFDCLATRSSLRQPPAGWLNAFGFIKVPIIGRFWFDLVSNFYEMS